MRILVVSQYFWPENFRINDWVSGMVERGHHVTVLTSLPNYPMGVLHEDYKKNPQKFKYYNKVEVVRVPQILRGNSSIKLFLNYISFALLGATFGVWKLKKRKVDVIFVFAVSPILMVIPAISFKLFRKAPIFLWVLDLWPDVLKSLGVIKSEKILSILRYFVGILYNQCDCVAGQSQMFLESIRKTSPSQKNTICIPSWAENLDVGTKNTTIEKIILEKKGIFNIFYTGNLGEAQDFPTIISAAKLLREDKSIKWFIVGDGRKKAYIENQIKENDLFDVFHLVGQHPIETMGVFFKHASVGLLCLKSDESLCKTIPGKFQTYCAYGLPILGSADGEVFKIVNQNKIGKINRAGDSIGLADNILYLKSLNTNELAEIAKNSKSYYTNNFERSTVLKKFENELMKLMK